MDERQPTAADLSSAPLFADLTDEARAVLARRFQVEEFETGRRLVTEGRPGYTFYVIAQGHVAVEYDGEAAGRRLRRC